MQRQGLSLAIIVGLIVRNGSVLLGVHDTELNHFPAVKQPFSRCFALFPMAAEA
ncbi:hypothetical protein [Ensifer sp. 22460]|uniref:hypothetical protein n=1 Tax=Ensifer sp. 22460 TaxID=3453922 RepID=UPI003F85F9FE